MEMAQHACIGIVVLILQIWWGAVEGRAPMDPVQCDSAACRVSNTYGSWPDRLLCTAAQVVYPTTEAQLLSAVAAGVQRRQKMKVVSKYAHSSPKLACPGGSEGLIISTRDYNRDLTIDKDKMTVTADSGIELRQLLDGIAAAGLALTHSPYWQGVSLGGLLSTGAHGSSFYGKGSAVHEYVVGMRLVVPAPPDEGYAKVIELTEKENDELDAAKVSLGVLGVISKVTLQLEPMFKRSITFQSKSDEDLEEQILSFASAHEFGDVTWHPAQSKAIYRIDDRVPVDDVGDGVFDFIGFRPLSAAVLGTARTTENLQEAKGIAKDKCVIGRLQVSAFQLIGRGLRQKKNSGFSGVYPVVGYQHQMQASGSCLSTRESDPRVCPWDSRVNGEFYFVTALSIPVSKVQAFIEDVKALREKVVGGFCGVDLYNGIYMRFVKASTAYLGKPYDAVDLDVTYYRAREEGQARVVEDVMEEVEQMAAFKYGGVAHWGKNRPVAFMGVSAKYPQLQRFLQVKEKLDPQGLFSSDWSDFLLGLAPLPTSTPGCALEGLCICSQHTHCAPHVGYFCQPGRVYHDARVCRKL